MLPMLQVQVRGCDGQVLPQPSIFIFEVEDLLHHKCSVACSSIPSPQPSFSGACRCLLNYPLHMPSHTCSPSNERRMCIQPYAHHDKKIKERPA